MRKVYYSYKVPINRVTIFLSFLLFSISIQAGTKKNDKIELLKKTKELWAKEVGDKSINGSQTIAYIDSVISQKSIDEKEVRSCVKEISKNVQKEGKLISVIKLLFIIISHYEQKETPTEEEQQTLLHCYIPMGAAHEEMGLWNQALVFYSKGLSIAEKLNIDKFKAMIYNNVSVILYKQNMLEKAKYYVEKSLKINLTSHDKKELSNNYNILAGIYAKEKKEDKALEFALKAAELLDIKKEPYLYYFMQVNIAELHLEKKEYVLATAYLRNAMKEQSRLGFYLDLVQTYSVLAETYEQMQIPDSAQFYIDKALKVAQKVNNKYLESQVLRKQALYFEKHNQHHKVYAALTRSMQLSDSIAAKNDSLKMNNLQKVYEVEKKNKENQTLIKEITLEKTISDRLWIIMASIAALLVVIVLYLINLYKNKEKDRKVQKQLVEHQAELYEKEKKIQVQKEQEMSNTINLRNRELTSYTLHLIKNNEFISDLNGELKQLLLELNPKDKTHRERIQQLLRKIYYQNLTCNWEEFKYYFEQVHPSFYDNLEKNYPILTAKDKRLCAFLRLGLSSKDISSITCKELRSVESARNRLRKKMDISPEVDLAEFLRYSEALNIESSPSQ